jgi:hypothetical protein
VVLGEFAVKIKDVVKEGIFSKKPVDKTAAKIDSGVQHWTQKFAQQPDKTPAALKSFVASITNAPEESLPEPNPNVTNPINVEEYLRTALYRYYNQSTTTAQTAAMSAPTANPATPQPTAPAPTTKKQISVKDHAGVVWIKDPHDQIWRSSQTNDEVTDKADIFKLEQEALRKGQYPQLMSTKSGITTPNATPYVNLRQSSKGRKGKKRR